MPVPADKNSTLDSRLCIQETVDDGNQYFEYYVLYWRKWWGFRNDVMNEFCFADGDYSFPLTVEQLEKIQEIYNYYNSEDLWQDLELLTILEEKKPYEKVMWAYLKDVVPYLRI